MSISAFKRAFPQCFDTVGWTTGRASGLCKKDIACVNRASGQYRRQSLASRGAKRVLEGE